MESLLDSQGSEARAHAVGPEARPSKCEEKDGKTWKNKLDVWVDPSVFVCSHKINQQRIDFDLPQSWTVFSAPT